MPAAAYAWIWPHRNSGVFFPIPSASAVRTAGFPFVSRYAFPACLLCHKVDKKPGTNLRSVTCPFLCVPSDARFWDVTQHLFAFVQNGHEHRPIRRLKEAWVPVFEVLRSRSRGAGAPLFYAAPRSRHAQQIIRRQADAPRPRRRDHQIPVLVVDVVTVVPLARGLVAHTAGARERRLAAPAALDQVFRIFKGGPHCGAPCAVFDDTVRPALCNCQCPPVPVVPFCLKPSLTARILGLGEPKHGLSDTGSTVETSAPGGGLCHGQRGRQQKRLERKHLSRHRERPAPTRPRYGVHLRASVWRRSGLVVVGHWLAPSGWTATNSRLSSTNTCGLAGREHR